MTDQVPPIILRFFRSLISLLPTVRGRTRLAKLLFQKYPEIQQPFQGEIGNGVLIEYWPWQWNDFGTYLVGSIEPFFLAHFESKIEKDSVIFDVGAYIGNFGFSAANRVGNGSVHLFEPDPRSYKRIAQAVSSAGLQNFHVSHAAVGRKAGETEYYLSEDMVQSGMASGAGRRDQLAKSTRVAVIDLDGYCSSRGIQDLHLLKLDVEGAELLVLEGAYQTLNNFHPVIFLEVHRDLLQNFGGSTGRIVGFLSDLDYALYAVRSSWTGPKLVPAHPKELDAQPRKLIVAYPK